MNKNLNLISNDCMASFMYKLNDIPYNHPFVWTRIFIDDYYKFIKDFKNLDFTNIEVLKGTIWDHKSVRIKVDGIDINYVHYNFDVKAEKPYHANYNNNVDLFYKHIFKYAYEKYNARLLRMNCDTMKFSIFQEEKISDDLLKKFLDLDICMFIILTDKQLYERFKNYKTKSILKYHEGCDMIHAYEKFKDEWDKFLG